MNFSPLLPSSTYTWPLELFGSNQFMAPSIEAQDEAYLVETKSTSPVEETAKNEDPWPFSKIRSYKLKE